VGGWEEKRRNEEVWRFARDHYALSAQQSSSADMKKGFALRRIPGTRSKKGILLLAKTEKRRGGKKENIPTKGKNTKGEGRPNKKGKNPANPSKHENFKSNRGKLGGTERGKTRRTQNGA